MSEPQQPNQLGTASLGLGIASAALVFGIGIRSLVGALQGWIQLLGMPLWICGASSAFLGLLAVLLGITGLFGKTAPGPRGSLVWCSGLGGCIFLSGY